MPIVKANIAKEAMVMTDDSGVYLKAGDNFHAHGVVNHSAEEYVAGIAHTNTIEGSFSIFKRGMKGVYQHCGEQHLHRYLADFDFRYTHRERTGFNDAARADQAIRGIVGKRLTYRRPDIDG
ncbi:IS1595 family transposase [Sphingomonas solaris]|uniref:IS1595 family transposase n=2 Tax=Alterirhizorhabdus solaris TaxID=2529389 RepID=A0A558R9K1_9SPHN|nr:IS1595 family transposase [Sphingomonas solaris]